MQVKEQYGYLKELVEKGKIKISTKDINDDNIDSYFDNIIAILSDGIEEEFVQKMKIDIEFTDNKEITLSIMDFMFNLMFWTLITVTGKDITSKRLYFEKAITKDSIKNYIDKNFIKENMLTMDIIKLNQTIDRAVGKFRSLVNFQLYLSNTFNLKDTIDLMRKYNEFNDTVHFDISNIPLEDIKDKGMQVTNKHISYIEDETSEHCLKDAFLVGEGVNRKQYRELAINIGTKPNGMGSVFPNPIKHSFMNGGLSTAEELTIDSSIGRIAQILKKKNVGDSGAFARNLGLNNVDSKLHDDPNYSCDTKNYQIVNIKSQKILEMFNMRWYKFNPKGPLYLLDSDNDNHLIGETLYFRSPMTCASAARGEGICYKCYGNLAHVNKDINIGQIASELLTSIYTQILLSAKHLLESAIVKIEWIGPFKELFAVEFNQIGLRDSVNYKGMKLIIDPEDIINDEREEDNDSIVASNMYISSFSVKTSDENIHEIRTTNADEMYVHIELLNYMDTIGLNNQDVYELDMSKLKELSLFEMDVKNNELSKTMKVIKNIIDNKATTKSFDRNTILEAFIDNNLMGGIKLNSVHYEVLLMNQIRNVDDILELPDWRHINEQYQILTLTQSLKNNRSISIRLQSEVSKNIISPDNRFLNKPSIMDLYAMEKPQGYMSGEIELSDYTLIDEESEEKSKSPIYFFS